MANGVIFEPALPYQFDLVSVKTSQVDKVAPTKLVGGSPTRHLLINYCSLQCKHQTCQP